MNKIKLLYDVVKTMKEKEIINGFLTVNGKKDQAPFVSFENEFQRNLTTGEVKAKITSQLDLEGKKVKHESSTEFNVENHKGMHHSFHEHMHHHHNQHDGRGGMTHHSFKDKLTILAFVLKTIDSMEIDEQSNTLVSLHLSEVPEELKKVMHWKHHHNGAEEHHKHPLPFKDFLTMEKTNIDLTWEINKNKEVERITLSVDGKQNGELNAIHEINFTGELRLTF